MELYKKYRPTVYSDIIGQEGIIKALKQYDKKKTYPHSIMMMGPSGTSKTTLARIIASKLDKEMTDYVEINSAEVRGIDNIRDIGKEYQLEPMGGKARVYCIDECHKITNDAQSAMLKMLEDTPAKTWFILCTTEPGKVLKAIHTRCTKFKTSLLSSKQLEELIKKILVLEKKKIKDKVIAKIISCSAGSPRTALVSLDQVIGLKNSVDQLAAIVSPDEERQAFDIVRAVLYNRGTKWPDVIKILSEINDDNPEGIRQLVLKCATDALLKGNGRGYSVIQAFRDNYYECGRAGLVASCYEVVMAK